MLIRDWNGKIEKTEIESETIEEVRPINALPLSDYYIRADSNKADKIDYLVAASSGIITAALDMLWVGEVSLLEAQSMGSDFVNNFVISCAKAQGCKKSELKDCIQFLEKKYPLASDKLTNEFGGGLQHHLRDFSHHFSPFGLLCSILNQFTLHGYGTDTNGNIITIDLPQSAAIGENVKEKIWWGIVNWTFHMISDMAGSSGSQGSGTGIPGPILSLAKFLSAMPLFKDLSIKYKDDDIGFSVWISKLFNGTAFSHSSNSDLVRFDFRTELGIGFFTTKQTIPVFINQCIVRSFYLVRRLAEEYSKTGINNITDLKSIDFDKITPFNNKCIDIMITIATGTFTMLDVTEATFRSYAQNPKSKSQLFIGMMRRINFAGIAAFSISITKEVGHCLEDAKHFFNQETKAKQIMQYKSEILMESSIDMEVLMDNSGIYEYSFKMMTEHINESRTKFALAQASMLSLQKPIFNISDEQGILFNNVAKMSKHPILVETEKLMMRLFKNNNIPYTPFSEDEIYKYLPFFREEGGKKTAYYFDTSIAIRLDNWKLLKEKYNLDRIKVVALVSLQEDTSLMNDLISFEERKTNDFVKYITIKDLFDLIGEEEYSVYLKYVEKFNKDIRIMMGYSTITIPSKDMMSLFKEKMINTITNFDYRKYTKDLRESQIKLILTNYLVDERFRVVLGDSNFADSFLSAEWYYSMHNSTSGIEQTAIIAGYLKSVEQLLYEIIHFSIDTGKDIKKKNDKDFIQYSTDNEASVDYTLSSMIAFMKHYPDLWQVNNYARYYIIDILTKYRTTYRNDHFHKDNVYKKSEIDEIREQTLLVYALLIGGSNLSKLNVASMQPYYKEEVLQQTLTYSDVEEWLNAILGGDNLLNPEVAIYFCMNLNGPDLWQLNFCTINNYSEEKDLNKIDYPYISNPLMWPSIVEKEEAEKEMISFICKYLNNGKYKMKLKKHHVILAGYFGHSQILHTLNKS